MQLDRWRVSDGYFNTAGHRVETDPDIRRALHKSLSRGSTQEDGAALDGAALVPTWFVTHGDPAELSSPARLALEDGTQVTATDALPPDLPLGAHQLVPDDGGPTTNLFVVPPRQSPPGRSWGWSSQLYASRSAASWGHGDLSDLARLSRWASASGASLVAHNPLGSSLPLSRQEPSPYFGSSRRYLSVLYADISAVMGAELLGSQLDGLARAGRDLNGSRLIDRDRVFRLKMAALETIYSTTRADPRVLTAIESADAALLRHSVFCALSEKHQAGWPNWPERFRRPDSPAVEEFRRANVDRVNFWCWVHLELDAQLSAASRAGAGLMADLAVGFDPQGSDAWVDQDLLALDCRIGAPGDEFNPAGQDWGVTPYVPWKLRNAGYKPWLLTLRQMLKSCAGLRIDHVMGLFRLFWLPRDVESPATGAYVYQYGTELLDLALMEAVRAGVWLAGEDLGTVEEDVRSAMTARGILGYRVGWFEDDRPEAWPTATIGMLNTHDLPTAAGVWELGRGDQQDGHVENSVDDNEKLLLDRLVRLAGTGDGDAGVDTRSGPEVERVILGAHEALAGAGSSVVLASLDDAQVVTEQPNHPGTTDEFPNWKLALPVLIDDLDDTLAPQIAVAMERNNRAAASGSAEAAPT